MSCLAKLLFLPILLVFILILMLFSMFRGGSKRVFTSTRRQDPESEPVDDDRNRQRYDNAETVDYEELPPAEKTDDNESDYDPNPTNNNRIEDAKWEEIEE